MDAPACVDREESMKSFEMGPIKMYRHQPLDTSTQQIRLIKLRLDENNRLQFDISVFELSSAPPFVALSYTWGPPSPQFNISVNGEPLSIRENLFQFFQTYVMTTEDDFPWEPTDKYADWTPAGDDYVWKPMGDEYLWIDQICIDQTSVKERNHQVGMMGSIYSRCHETIIWLGNIHNNRDVPFALRDTKDRLVYSRESDLLYVTSITRNDYFTRVWIVQEIILSDKKKVLYNHPSAGPVWVDWSDLCRIAGQFQYRVPPIPASYLVKSHLPDIWMTLLHAVRLFSQSHCQDPRDKVYGFMGLVEEEQRLTINYAKSLEVLLLDVMAIFYEEFVTQRRRAIQTYLRVTPWTTSRTEELVGDLSHSYAEYQNALVELGRSWSIMSTSLDAFLYDVWVKATYDWHQKFGSERPGPDVYPYIQAMGYFPEAPDQNMKLKRKELLPYSVGVERDLGYFEPAEWTPTKDCWWYEVDGITYEIYGLVRRTSPSDGIKEPGYYGKKIRRPFRGWKSRIRLPAWPVSRRSIRSG